MPVPADRIPVQLIEAACAIATQQNSTGLLNASLVAKIAAAPLDTTLGEQLAFREPICTAAELQDLYAFFRAVADSFGGLGGYSPHVQVCADAAASVKLSLSRSGLTPSN